MADHAQSGAPPMTVEKWVDLMPSAGACRDMRDQTGDGLAEVKRILLRKRIDDALNEIEPDTPNERTLVAILTAARIGGLI